MVDCVILGADEPVGQKFLRELLESGKRSITGISVSSPAVLTAELLASLPDLKAIGLRKGTFNKAPQGVTVLLGNNCEMKLVDRLHPTEVALCTWGIRSSKIYQELAKTRSAILLGDTATVLLDEIDPEELAGVRSLDLRMKIARILASSCEEGDTIQLVYEPDEKVLKTPAQTLYRMTGKELAKEGLEPSGRAEEALSIRPLLDVAMASKLSDLPIDRFTAITGDPSIHPAIIRRADGSLVTIDHQNQVVPVEPEFLVSYEPLDEKRYPLFSFLKNQISRFGRLAELAILASSEASLQATGEGKIDLSSVETIIRRSVSTATRNLHAPRTPKEESYIFDLVYEDSSIQVERLFNARKNHNSNEDIRRSRQLNRRKVLSDRAKAIEKAARKKASRWRNNPEKQELWNEHLKARAKRERLAKENEKRQRERLERGRRANASTHSFPVTIVADEREDRERHLRERESRNRRPTNNFSRKNVSENPRSRYREERRNISEGSVHRHPLGSTEYQDHGSKQNKHGVSKQTDSSHVGSGHIANRPDNKRDMGRGTNKRKSVSSSAHTEKYHRTRKEVENSNQSTSSSRSED